MLNARKIQEFVISQSFLKYPREAFFPLIYEYNISMAWCMGMKDEYHKFLYKVNIYTVAAAHRQASSASGLSYLDELVDPFSFSSLLFYYFTMK